MPNTPPVMQPIAAEAAPAALGRLRVLARNGDEPIHDNGGPLGLELRDFWRWSASDLVSNVALGVFAEFLVAYALGIDVSGVRDSWAAFDLVTPDGIRVEVMGRAGNAVVVFASPAITVTPQVRDRTPSSRR